MKLTESPFVRWLHYGQNSDGYWNYHYMIVQLEDIVDVLHVLFSDKYEFVFFFDHSSGHDHLRPDGFNANAINKYYAGMQPKMRKSEIKDNTYLGPFQYPDRLKIGDVQSMQFDHSGPFYLSDEEKTAKRFDRESGEIEKKKHTRSQLIKMIQEKSPLTKPNGNLKVIQALAVRLKIPIEFERNKTEEGWSGKQKGSLQILWERGFLDPLLPISELKKKYSINGKKDENEKVIEGTSLKELIANLPNFKHEKTLLQYRAEQLGVSIQCSPKYHPEIAGEGIEFCWGIAKNTY